MPLESRVYKEWKKTLVRSSEERTIKKQGSGKQKMSITFRLHTIVRGRKQKDREFHSLEVREKKVL